MTDFETLLAAHQAIIDAWYDAWLKRQQDRADEWWIRKRKELHPHRGRI